MLLIGAATGAYLTFGREPDDVLNEDVPFEEEVSTRHAKPRKFVWPTYGYTRARTRHLRASIEPPYRRLWTFKSKTLLEFPPILAGGTLFFVNYDAVAFAVTARTGKVEWRREVGSLNASSPAYSPGRIYISTLSGALVSLSAKTGKRLWVKRLPSRTESSPLVVGNRLFFGSEDGTVYAVRTGDGGTVWKYRAGGAVKGALAYSKGRLFFGDYAGQVSAIRARDGRRVWRTGTSGLPLGRSGNFYSTPAVAFGRVYIGNTDSKIYSFSARDGRLAWTRDTGDYVYGSPAVADTPDTPPSVYLGSKDGYLYALHARTGRVRWKYHSGGRLPGAPTVVGKIVYFSDSIKHVTWGLKTRTGKPVFRFLDGGFTPVISDGRRLYVTGWRRQYALAPRR